MIKFKIVEKDNYNYILVDNYNKNYNINIEFYDLEEQPNIGDCIYISEKMVREINIYSFCPIRKHINNVNEEDIIKVIIKGKEYYLQRYYG